MISATAYHEAAHAFIAMSCGLAINTITPGRVSFDFVDALPDRDDLMITVAGIVAEAMLDNQSVDANSMISALDDEIELGDGQDDGTCAWAIAGRMRKTAAAQERAIVAACREAHDALRAHWDSVEKIAMCYAEAEAEAGGYFVIPGFEISELAAGGCE